ncbi:hypothetical protein F511_36525 [Dorcoceras hygrometricum]|uniref:Uncharacterized protein n=1 Tax=Dorcoceras hygrometricum TaxID=472368 RepID=A0A2Z7D2K0_9LAMI|nr:hypothetical protein F511_36525 [Dorcoceras hygrometricum]
MSALLDAGALILTGITPRLMSILSEIFFTIPGDIVVQRGRGVYWLDSWRHDFLLGKHSRAERKSSGNRPELSVQFGIWCMELGRRVTSKSIVRSAAEPVDSVPTSPETREPMLPDQANWAPRDYLGTRRKRLTLADRMGNAAMLKALKERPKEGSSRRSEPKEKEEEGSRGLQEGGLKPDEKEGLHLRVAPRPYYRDTPSLDARDSFVVSPSRSAATGLLCNMVPDRDIDLVRNDPDLEVLGSFADRFTETMVWGGEVINRLTRALREVTSSRQCLDEVLENHMELAKQLEELEAISVEERRELEARWVALEAEKEALEVEKEALAAELADTRARAEGEIRRLSAENEHLKSEAENA